MASTRAGSVRLYEKHAAAADRGGWSVETEISWADIDRRIADDERELHEQVRAAALIESFHPVNLGRLTRLAWNDVDACVVFALEGYEGFKHFHALRTYLDRVGYAPPITDEEIVSIRSQTALAADPGDLIEELVEFMLSEHLAHHFFRRLAEASNEPVLVRLLRLIAADEVRHAQAAADLIEKRIRREPDVKGRVLAAAASFRHFGEKAIGEVPIAMPGDPRALQSFARRIERLCGSRLVDYLKAAI